MRLLFFMFFGVLHGLQLPFLNMGISLPSIPRIGFSLPDPLFNQQDDGMLDARDEDGMIDGMIPNFPFGEGKMLNEKDVKTKNNTFVKDGYKYTTINKTGPGFFSYMTEVMDDGKKGNKSKFDISSKLFKGGSLLNLINGGVMKDGKKKCKKCSPGKYCDPMFGKCRKQLSEGNICMLINQCEKGLRCVWGRCNRAEAGAPGTFCKKKDQCDGDACCIRTEGSFHAMCIPPLDEGAVCGQQSENSFMNLLSPERNKEDKQCSPCKPGLKCGGVGNMHYKKCVPLSYSEEPKEANNDSSGDEDDEEKKQKDDKNDNDEDDNSGMKESSKDDDDDNDDDVDPEEGGIPVQTKPKKKKKQRGEKV